MEKKLKYSFDDEPVSRFYYDLDNKRIQIHFKRYYDLIENLYIEKPCAWVIESWVDAKSRIGDELKLYDLNKHIGIFCLLLYTKYNNDEELEILVNTVDNRYVTMFFKDPEFNLKEV